MTHADAPAGAARGQGRAETRREAEEGVPGRSWAFLGGER